jgi:hypothetical protein
MGARLALLSPTPRSAAPVFLARLFFYNLRRAPRGSSQIARFYLLFWRSDEACHSGRVKSGGCSGGRGDDDDGSGSIYFGNGGAMQRHSSWRPTKCTWMMQFCLNKPRHGVFIVVASVAGNGARACMCT